MVIFLSSDFKYLIWNVLQVKFMPFISLFMHGMSLCHCNEEKYVFVSVNRSVRFREMSEIANWISLNIQQRFITIRCYTQKSRLKCNTMICSSFQASSHTIQASSHTIKWSNIHIIFSIQLHTIFSLTSLLIHLSPTLPSNIEEAEREKKKKK